MTTTETIHGLIRPQPLGLQPLPTGGLLVPDVPGARDAATAWVAGRTGVETPDALRFYAAALADDLEAARLALGATPDDPVRAYNRFVLEPEPGNLEALRVAADGHPVLEPLAACVAYAAGTSDAPPAERAIEPLDGEVRAFARACVAAGHIERGELVDAERLLRDAVEDAGGHSPGQAAQLTLSRLEILRNVPTIPCDPVAILQEALERLDPRDGSGIPAGFDVLAAEIRLEIAVALQETPHPHGPQHGFRASVPYLQDCLRGLDPASHPRAHGFAQSRLGLAYLSQPMSTADDQLRMGVGVQALQKAVEILSPERDPDLWPSVAINLANAYQLVPTKAVEEKYTAAVGLYDRVLAVRTAEKDPLGHGRVLLNRANALGTLGRLDEARADLDQARALFLQVGAREELEGLNRMILAVDEAKEQAAAPAAVDGQATEGA